MAGRLEGEIALATGGASGIGAAMTRHFVACYLDEDIEKDMAGQHHWLVDFPHQRRERLAGAGEERRVLVGVAGCQQIGASSRSIRSIARQ